MNKYDFEDLNDELSSRNFEFAKENSILKQQLAIALEALKKYAYGQIESVEENIDGEDEVFTYPYSNDDGETAKEALMKMQSVK